MRLIARSAIDRWAEAYPDAASALEAWTIHAEDASWRNLIDVRKTYPSADAVQVRSGGTVTVFNIRGNRYRLLAAIHYNREIVYMLRFLTHAEYDEDRWKKEL